MHLDVVVADFDSAVSRAGARIELDVRTVVWSKIAVFADPFGHGLCLIEFLNQGYDELAGPLP